MQQMESVGVIELKSVPTNNVMKKMNENITMSDCATLLAFSS